MTYLPQSDSEFVTLACWAFNAVGQQKSPCLVHIIPASKFLLLICIRSILITLFKILNICWLFTEIPDPPRSCEIRNDTTLEVLCSAGFNGGLDQHFLLEVISSFPLYHTETTRDDHEIENEISTMNDQVHIFWGLLFFIRI